MFLTTWLLESGLYCYLLHLFCVREYLSNIGLVDAGIQRVVDMVEDFYGRDGRTAYVMSSDHGMTDWGSYCGSALV